MMEALIKEKNVAKCTKFIMKTKCTTIHYLLDCKNDRRLIGGKPVEHDHRYVVYFLKSEKSTEQRYDEWLCGGAIVSPTKILTAAACLVDVSHLYVIAGYKKYVRTEDLDQDECTKNWKQRVVKTCIPKTYNFSYTKASDWMAMDIGVATVEKPYNFTDLTYRIYCSYVPKPIRLNIVPTVPELNMLMFGWGHTRGLRLPGDTADYNSRYLQVATTTYILRRDCVQLINEMNIKNEKLKETVSKYMMCTSKTGMLDSEGDTNEEADIKFYRGCRGAAGNDTRRGMGSEEGSEECHDIEDNMASNSFEKIVVSNGTDVKESNKTLGKTIRVRTRRGNICVNDHGSPLVSWGGSDVVLMGVAVSSFFDEFDNCVDPSFFTSTRCTSRFIMCALHDMSTRVRRKMCQNLAEEEGYELHETDVDWSTTNDDQFMDSHYESFEDAEIRSRRSKTMKKPFSNYTIVSLLTTKANST